MSNRYRIISKGKVTGRGDPIKVGTVVEIDDPKRVLRWSKFGYIDPKPVKPPKKTAAKKTTTSTRTDDD